MKPLHEEEGWVGAFTREHADGAIANGEPIIKVKAEDTDANPIGTVGTVLGSFEDAAILDGHTHVLRWL